MFLLEWAKDPGKYCDQFWPGWDKRLKEVELIKPGFKESLKIKDISELLTYLINSVNQLMYGQLYIT